MISKLQNLPRPVKWVFVALLALIIAYMAWDMWFATPQKGTAVVTSLTSDPASEAAGGTPGTLVSETAAPNIPGNVPDHAPGVASTDSESQSPQSPQTADLGSPGPAAAPSAAQATAPAGAMAGTSGADRVSTNLPGNAGGNVANVSPAVLLQRLDRYEQRLEAVIAGLRAKGYLKDAADKDAPIRLEDFNPYRPTSGTVMQKAQPRTQPVAATAPVVKASMASAKRPMATTDSKSPDKSPSLVTNSNSNSNSNTETRPITSAASTNHADNELLAVDVWDGVPSAVIGTGVPGDKRVKVYRVGDMERGVGVKAVDVETQTATFNVFGKEITLTTTGAPR